MLVTTQHRFTAVPRLCADKFMKEFEHLGNIGLGVWHYGYYIDDKLASVLSFGVPCFSPKRSFLHVITSSYDLRLLQLCRGGTADWAPKNTPSHTIGLALHEIQKCFGCSLIVAYADPSIGEIGTIYQSCNAVYTGWTNPKGQANYIIGGKHMSGWSVRKLYGTRDRLQLRALFPDMIIEPLIPKLRYVLVAAPKSLKKIIINEMSTITLPYLSRKDLHMPSMHDFFLI